MSGGEYCRPAVVFVLATLVVYAAAGVSVTEPGAGIPGPAQTLTSLRKASGVTVAPLQEPVTTPVDAACGLIDRVLGPNMCAQMKIALTTLNTSPPAGSDPAVFDTFTLGAEGGKVAITGSSGVAIASGFKLYLDTYLHGQITWSGDHIPTVDPTSLPLPTKTHEGKSPYQYRYYQNVCTVSYTMAFWDWKRWEREIDWMAMNGINLPLAFNGQEYVWVELFKSMGLSETEVNDLITGPGFYAWNRMGNMQSWAGLTEARAFNEAQMQLQQKILARMRSLSITPVLPAFAGHVPRALKSHYESANITMSPNWGTFPPCCGGVDLLAPTDPLFQKIGADFIRLQTKIYGEGLHIFNADTFNEMRPPTSDPAYLTQAAKAVYDSMATADPQAIWLMQGWLFMDTDFWKPEQIQALLKGVPDDKMIILDLTADVFPIWDRTESFYGKPYIWCMLHNYGGNVGLYGKLPTLNTAPPAALKSKNNSMVGIGLTPEGIHQNYMVYEFMMSNTWRSEPTDLNQWVADYVTRRYGTGYPPAALTAYNRLVTSVYNNTNTQMGVTKGYFEVRPALALSHDGFMPTKLFYNPADVVAAWADLVSVIGSAPGLTTVDTFRYDLTDVTRQVFSDYFIVLHTNLVAAYNTALGTRDSTAVKAAGAALTDLLTDLDSILATNEHFLLGTWIRDAVNWTAALTDRVRGAAELDFNARNQVTMWGPTGEINDYASKQWSGLVKDYYLPRWSMFVSELVFAVDINDAFKADVFTKHVYALELHWNNSGPREADYSPLPTGDTTKVTLALFYKYHGQIAAAYRNPTPTF